MDFDTAQPGHWHPASRPDVATHSSQQSHREPEPAPFPVAEPAPLPVTEPAPFPVTAPTTAHTGDVAGDNKPEPALPPVIGAILSPDDEIPDDEDDERFDPAWGFSRSNTEALLSSANRSASFPVERVDDSLETAQRENKAEGNKEYQARELPQSDPWQEQGLNNLAEENALLPEEDAEDARYEEGVPLISADSRDDGNFHNTAADIERKSTAAVLEGLGLKPSAARADGEKTDISHEAALSAVATETVPIVAPSADKEDAWGEAAPAAGLSEKEQVDDAWKAIMDDDDDFLVDDPDDLLPDSDSELGSSDSSDSFGALLHQSKQATTPPPAHRSAFPQRTSSVSAPAPEQLSPPHRSLGLSEPALPPIYSFQNHLQQQPPTVPTAAPAAAAAPTAESFVDQSKGSYKSPYDLPTDLSKPRKRIHVPPPVQATKPAAPPPPRTNAGEIQLQPAFIPEPRAPQNPGLFPSAPAALPAPTPVLAAQPGLPAPGAAGLASPPAPAPATLKPKSSTFFEELPITTRPRKSSTQDRYTPHPSIIPTVSGLAPPPPPPPGPGLQKPLPPQPQPLPSPPQAQVSAPLPQAPQQTDAFAQYQLRQPDRLDPFSNTPLQPPPVSTSRYSPAPQATIGLPRTGPSPRYSPAPPAQAAPPAPNRYASQPHVHQAPASPARHPVQQPLTHPPPASSQLPFAPRTSSPLAQHAASADQESEEPPAVDPSQQSRMPVSLPKISSPPPAQPYAPLQSRVPPPVPHPPRRSQTQSPGGQWHRPALQMSPPSKASSNRPASAHSRVPPVSAFAQRETTAPVRGMATEPDLVAPNDESGADVLQRWKGAPIFRFGFGGTLVSSFPKQIPRYSQGSLRPQIKRIGGDISIRASKDVVPLPDHIASFPGPLKSKSKKKDVLAWLTASIARLESESSQQVPDRRRLHEERILLVRVLRSLVEHDGTLDTGPGPIKSVNAILSPEIHAVDEATATQYRADDVLSGIYHPSGTSAKPDAIDPMGLEVLRKHLLRGNRQDAVWHAVDSRLWSHALIIASTVSPEVWRQVVQEFVKQEVKPVGANTESLSALYEIFAGNMADAADQLVPLSARAGLQMLSTVDQSAPTRNALDGLDRWRETVTLIINNRTQGDHQALVSLGRLLAQYSRTHAAHICFLFSRTAANPAILGGSDDPLASLTLLGADRGSLADHESILLTEVYEFATLVLGGHSTIPFLPYLSPYKLQRAILLAEAGLKVEAQAYCDVLAASVNKSTKTLPYYNRVFLGELEDFQNRLKEVPVQTPGSWAKPNLEKVSSSLLGKFSSFVAGDDSDAESKSSNKEDADGAAPSFGGFIPIKRDEVQLFPPQPPSGPSGYEPARQTHAYGYEPYSSPSGLEQRSYEQASQPNSYGFGPPPQFSAYEPPSQPSAYEPPSQPSAYEPPSQSSAYEPPSQSSAYESPSEPSGYEQPNQPDGYGYEPPSDTGYTPYVPEPDEPKAKKSFMDDDDDEFPRVSKSSAPSTVPIPAPHAVSSPAAQRAANDAAADAAFLAAAEADAKAAAEKEAAAKAAKKGWFGGLWGGGKKDGSLDSSSASASQGGAEPKVYKANLGEDKMKIYFDKTLNKWVNPDNPEAATKAATPPPPRAVSGLGGPPPRASSAIDPRPMGLPSGGPISNPPSRQSTPANGPPVLSGPATLPSSTQTGLGLSSSGPPSRPGTATSKTSNQSSIEDLLGPGPPTGRKSVRAKKGAKGGRYVDVMAK
ncbi:hypothetical protein DV735_g2590, partial [Chaetothyriales sp. CBS 134920]